MLRACVRSLNAPPRSSRCFSKAQVRFRQEKHASKSRGQQTWYDGAYLRARRVGAQVERVFPIQFTLKALSYTVAIYLGIHLFSAYFFELAPASGISMLPTVPSHDCVLITSKYYRRGRGIVVGDLVSFKHPVKLGEVAVKRVIGMPGDFVLRDTPGAGRGMMQQVPFGHCYVVGDNLPYSRDSRMFGTLPLALINGKIVAKWGPGTWEFSGIRDELVDSTEYEVD